jgi:DNA ligase-associated metallophosphoesterase
MTAPTPLRIHNQQCWLSAERCLYWEDAQTLVVSDLHFGKTGHFRKRGIAVPQEVYKEDLYRLMQQAQHFQPKRIILTGDLFHSDENLEFDWFARWRESIPCGSIHLVAGNHDRLHIDRYTGLGLEYHATVLHEPPFLFIHDVDDETAGVPEGYRVGGHLHPGVRISGAGKQSLRFPCFWVTDAFTVLPAFSHFTGLHLVRASRADRLFAVLPGNRQRGENATVLQIQ